MSKSLNQYAIIGRVGKDPEIKHFEGGKSVASFSVATSDSWTDKQGVKQEFTEWHNVAIWGGLVKVVESYVNKGSLVYISGAHRTRSWDDNNGGKKYMSELNGKELILLGSKSDNQTAQRPAQQEQQPDPPEMIDDLPF